MCVKVYVCLCVREREGERGRRTHVCMLVSGGGAGDKRKIILDGKLTTLKGSKAEQIS